MTLIRTIGLAALLFPSIHAFAQSDIQTPKPRKKTPPTFGPIAGVSFSNGSVWSPYMKVATNTLVKFRFGAQAEFKVARKLFIQPGIAYTTNGFRTSFGGPYVNTVIRAVEFPLNLQYKTGGYRRSGLFLGAGLYYSISTTADQVEKGPNKTYNLQVGTAITPTMFGWSVNAGYQLSNGLFFRAAWNNGMSDYTPSNQAGAYHPYQFNVCFGYLFKTSKAHFKKPIETSN